MRCVGCEGGIAALSTEKSREYLQNLPGWKLTADNAAIVKNFSFKGFYKTMAFVNAIAWIVQQENHHPTLTVNYNSCDVLLTTHAVHGLTENDFICAVKFNALVEDVTSG